MEKKNIKFEVTEILEKIPENWHLKKRKAYAIYEMQKILELLGVDQINKSALVRKYHVHWMTIDKWYTNIIKSVPKDQIDIVGTKAELRLIKSFERMSRIASDPSARTSDRIAAEREIKSLNESQIRILEAYGRKAKVPFRVEFKGEGKISLAKLMEECQDGNESTDPDSPQE